MACTGWICGDGFMAKKDVESICPFTRFENYSPSAISFRCKGLPDSRWPTILAPRNSNATLELERDVFLALISTRSLQPKRQRGADREVSRFLESALLGTKELLMLRPGSSPGAAAKPDTNVRFLNRLAPSSPRVCEGACPLEN